MSRTIPSYTINSLTASDFSSLVFTSRGDGQGGRVLLCTGTYKVTTTPSDVSSPDQKFGSVTITCSSGQETAIRNFINSNLVPNANTQEGL